MSEFRITFGQKYRDEPHPIWPEAHPDGWLTIVAPDQRTAEEFAYRHFDNGSGVALFAFFYPVRADGRWDLYPRGEIARIDLTEAP